MKKTVLIPTDFTIDSLQILKKLLCNPNDELKYDIILVHGINLSDSISDLLYFSKKEIVEEMLSKDFDNALQIVKNKYNSIINSIRIELFSGYNGLAFDNFIEANKVDFAYIPNSYNYQLNNKKSVDIIPYINKSDLKVIHVEYETAEKTPEKGTIAEIFLNNISVSQ
jgi:hypothetical protein